MLPEATVEERGLYAEVRRVLADPKVDRDDGVRPPGDRSAGRGSRRHPCPLDESLQQLLYGIAALIELHIDKEERIYLELVAPAS